MTLMEALEILDASGGRLNLVGGRVNVVVGQEIPEAAWQALALHRDELASSLAAPREVPTTRLPPPAGADLCDRCGATETTDVVIHDGQSIRRDCARCGRFIRFSVWYGEPKTKESMHTPGRPIPVREGGGLSCQRFGTETACLRSGGATP